MSKFNKTLTIYNNTEYTITRLKLRHAVSMTEPHGDLLLSVDELKPQEKSHEVKTKACREGLNDYWYVVCNILLPVEKLGLKEYDKKVVVDGHYPLAMSNSKGWKQLNVESEDSYCHFHLEKINDFKNAADVKLTNGIWPEKSESGKDWLEPVGNGGESPTFSLVYPITAVAVGTILGSGCLGASVLAGDAITVSGRLAEVALAPMTSTLLAPIP